MSTGNLPALTLQGTTHLISDLHLSENTPLISQLFKIYCESHTQDLKNLIILGDFFEFYLGDDIVSPYQQKIANQLQKLNHEGVQIYFMPGNRDFLVRQNFLNLFQGILLPDPVILNLDFNKNYILTHGDSLCTRDTGYQILRFFLRTPWLESLILKLPKAFRAYAAQYLRAHSRAKKQNAYTQDLSKYDVTDSALQKLYQKPEPTQQAYRETHVIHGHTHKQAIHYGEPTLRYVLGDWHQTGNYLEISEFNSSPEFFTVSMGEGGR